MTQLKDSRRVALFLPSLAGGGAERVMATLANSLCQSGVSVDLVVSSASGAFMNQIDPGVRLVDLKSARVLSSLFALTRYLRRARPEALISALYHANMVAIIAARLAGTGVRVVVSEHNVFYSAPAENSSTPLSLLLYAFGMRLLYPLAHEVVAVSQGVAKDLRQVAKLRAPPRVIYNPVLSPQLYTRAQQSLSHPWFGQGEPPVILAVGRLDPVKGFSNLIRAIGLVRKTNPVRLMILGEGEERAKLQSEIDTLALQGAVSLVGFVENPYAYMKRAQLLVLSSFREGLPTVLIEALALGTPVVATDCEAGPSEILEQGRLGKLIPVNDVPAIAEAITTCLGTAALHTDQAHLKKYTQQAAVAAYLDAAGLPLAVGR